VKPEPFRIEPKFVPRIWGAHSLAPLYPEKANLPEPIGEVWLTGVDCKLATGPFAGKTLGEAWREMPPEWRGTRFAEPGDFPILIKFIFPNDKLSIQVHPDDTYAAAHEKAAGGRGKTEMWHVVFAKPGASLLLGLKQGVTKEIFVKALENQTLEELFQRHAAQEGDTYFVPAGTPHTIGPGMVICEVQEYSDITYRVYDYGRVDSSGNPRELHVSRALEVTNFGQSQGGKTAPLTWSTKEFKNSLLVACPYFATERWEVAAEIPVRSDVGSIHLFVFLSGKGSLRWDACEHDYQAGECWLMPASLQGYELIPATETWLTRTYVPELTQVRRSFQRLGISESAMNQVVFH